MGPTSWLGRHLDLLWLAAYTLVALSARESSVLPSERRRTAPSAAADAVQIVIIGGIAVLVLLFEIRSSFEPLSHVMALTSLTLLVVRLLTTVVVERNQTAAREASVRTDTLTGIGSRHLLLSTFQDPVLPQHAPGAVVLIDIDDFASVNSLMGYSVGDAVLRAMAQRLSLNSPGASVIVRLEGDTFAIGYRSGTQDDVVQWATDIRQQLRSTLVVDDTPYALNSSFGIALRSPAGEHGDELLRRAELAMRVAKRTRTGLQVWSPDVEPDNPQRLALATLLSHAVADGEIRAYFQPQMDLGSNRIVGVEALARWHVPQAGWVPPDEFVPIVEMLGLSQAFTLHMLRQAITEVMASAAAPEDLQVSVNLTERDLVDPDFRIAVDGVLQTLQFPASRLTLEITEAVLAEDIDAVSRGVQYLRDMGARISIDDFGTGFSNMSKLLRMPIDELKIDRSFVEHASLDSRAMAIVQTATVLGHELNATVIAEGAEDGATVALLRSAGVNAVQGFAIARPTPLDECDLNTRLLDERLNDAHGALRTTRTESPVLPRTMTVSAS